VDQADPLARLHVRPPRDRLGGRQTDPDTCVAPNPRLWFGWMDANLTAHFMRVDGATGATLDEVMYPWANGDGFSPYGGAVNAAGDFFATGLNNGPAVKIDAVTLQITDYGIPIGCKYGMSLDANGNIWNGGCIGGNVYVYDMQLGQWQDIGNAAGSRVNGVMADRDGNVWGAGSDPCRLVHIDAASRTFVNASIPLPGCSQPWGVSIDVDGYRVGRRHGRQHGLQGRPRHLPGRAHRRRPRQPVHVQRHDRRRPQPAGQPAQLNHTASAPALRTASAPALRTADRACSPHGLRACSPHGLRACSPHGLRACSHARTAPRLLSARPPRLIRTTLRACSPHGLRACSPHGLRACSPHDSPRLGPGIACPQNWRAGQSARTRLQVRIHHRPVQSARISRMGWFHRTGNPRREENQ
jgi:hypothetical protein